MSAAIQNLMTELEATRDRWNEIAERWSASGLPLEQSYAKLHGASFKEFNRRVIATLEIVAAADKLDENGQLLFIPKVNTVSAQLRAVKTNAENILNALKAQPSGVFKDTSNTLENITVHVGGSHVTTNNFAQYFDPLNAALSALFDLASTSIRFGRSRGLSLYMGYCEQLQGLAEQIKTLHSDVSLLQTEMARIVSSAGEQALAAGKSAEQAAESEEASRTAASAVKEALAEAEAKLASIRETAGAAASLQAQVEGYASSFDAFQESLDGRIASHEKFEQDMATALTENKKREDNINALIEKADTMIRGATTAGLSKSLDDTQAAYEKRLHRTGWWFLGSVVVLLVCLLPIAGQLIPGPWQEWFKPVADGNTDPWLATLGKIVLLLPATWATAFFAGNYAELFHLSREYAHKAAMAKAIDGFKREAPEYKDEIVAGVFMEIRENPGGRKSPQAATPKNPIFDGIFEKILDAIRAKKESAE